MSRKKSIVAGLLIMNIAVAAGCGAARPSKYYQLTVPGDATGADPAPFPVTLIIGRITAPELYRQDQIVYSSGGENMGTYEYQRWAEPPIEMISEVLLRQLRASGHFRSVNLLRSDMRGDFLLHGHLYDFKEVNGNGTVARVAMELELRDIKNGTTVWSHYYAHDEPASGKDINAIVAALDKNIQQGIAQFSANLDQYFKAHPVTQSAP